MSDKAETYSDSFNMVIKIEECLFVSSCHQGNREKRDEAVMYLFTCLTKDGLADSWGV